MGRVSPELLLVFQWTLSHCRDKFVLFDTKIGLSVCSFERESYIEFRENSSVTALPDTEILQLHVHSPDGSKGQGGARSKPRAFVQDLHIDTGPQELGPPCPASRGAITGPGSKL